MSKAQKPCDDCCPDISLAGEGDCSRCGWHQSEHRPFAPSNANMSGLEVVAWRRVDPNGKTATTDRPNTLYVWKASRRNIDDLVTAASAQARIAELEARVAELEAAKWEVRHVDTMNDMVAMGLARDAEKARADRLAKGLKDAEESARRYARCYEPSSDGRNTFLMLADHIHALQQETQP